MASIQEIVARRAPVASLPQASPNPNVGVGLISDAGSAGFRQLGQVRGISLDTATGFGQAGMVDASTVSMIGETIGNIATAIDSQKKSNEKDRIKSELNVIDKEFELLNKLTGKQRESQLNRINKHLDSFKTNYSDYEEIVENQIKAKRLELQALNVAHNVTTTRADTSMILDNNLREMSKSNDLAKAVEYYQDGIDHIDKLNVGIFSEVDKDRLRNAFKDSGNVQIRRLVVGKLAGMRREGMGKILESISEGKEFKDKPELDSISALLKNNGIKFTSDELKDAVGKKIVNNLKIENDIAEEKEKLEHEAEKKYIGLSKQIIDRVLQDVNVESIADRNNIEEQLREALFDGDEEDPRTSAYRNEINRYIDKVFNTNLDISREVNKRISDDFVSEFFREDPETGSTWAELIKTDGSSIDRMIESEGFKDFIKTSHPALVGNTEKQKALLRRASTNNSITTYNNDSDNRVKLISEQVKKEFIASLKPWQLKNPKFEVKKEAINAELLKIRSNPVLNEDEKIDAMRAIKKRFENKKASPQDSVWDTLPEDVKGLGVTIPSENLKGVLNPEVIYNGTALVKALDEYAGDHDSVELSKKLIVDGGDLAGLLEDPEYQNFILPIIKAHEASKNNIVPTPDEDGKESVRRLRLDEIEVKPEDISQVEGESEKLQGDIVNGIAENIGNLLKKPEDWVIDNVVQPVANYVQDAMRGKISESIPDPQIFESERSIGSGQRSQAHIPNDANPTTMRFRTTPNVPISSSDSTLSDISQGAQGGGEQFDPQQDLEELIGRKLEMVGDTINKEQIDQIGTRGFRELVKNGNIKNVSGTIKGKEVVFDVTTTKEDGTPKDLSYYNNPINISTTKKNKTRLDDNWENLDIIYDESGKGRIEAFVDANGQLVPKFKTFEAGAKAGLISLFGLVGENKPYTGHAKTKEYVRAINQNNGEIRIDKLFSAHLGTKEGGTRKAYPYMQKSGGFKTVTTDKDNPITINLKALAGEKEEPAQELAFKKVADFIASVHQMENSPWAKGKPNYVADSSKRRKTKLYQEILKGVKSQMEARAKVILEKVKEINKAKAKAIEDGANSKKKG